MPWTARSALRSRIRASRSASVEPLAGRDGRARRCRRPRHARRLPRDVDLRGRVLADQHDRQRRLDAAGRGAPRRRVGHRRLDLRRHDLAVEDLRHGGGPGQAGRSRWTRSIESARPDLRIDPDHGALEARPGPWRARSGSASGPEPLDRQLRLDADHGVDGPGQAEVGDVRRALRQHALVGRLDVASACRPRR